MGVLCRILSVPTDRDFLLYRAKVPQDTPFFRLRRKFRQAFLRFLQLRESERTFFRKVFRAKTFYIFMIVMFAYIACENQQLIGYLTGTSSYESTVVTVK